MRLALLASAFLAAPALAQMPADTAAHRLPFGATGNALELAVANTDEAAALADMTVAIASAPDWLHFAAREAGTRPAPRHMHQYVVRVELLAPVPSVVLPVVDCASYDALPVVMRAQASRTASLTFSQVL